MTDEKATAKLLQQIVTLLLEVREQFSSFMTQMSQQLETSNQLSEQLLHELQSLLGRTPALNELETPPDKEQHLLTLMLKLPLHLRPTYTFVLDHTPVTARMVCEKLGLSPSQASYHLQRLNEQFKYLDWRKGDKNQGESPYQKYYYPVLPSNIASSQEISNEELSAAKH